MQSTQANAVKLSQLVDPMTQMLQLVAKQSHIAALQPREERCQGCKVADVGVIQKVLRYFWQALVVLIKFDIRLLIA
jgi:uncharacterized protein with PIN domain